MSKKQANPPAPRGKRPPPPPAPPQPGAARRPPVGIEYTPTCPLCGSAEVLVPLGVPRDNVYNFFALLPDGSTSPAFDVGFCGGCGIARVTAKAANMVRREPVMGPERQPQVPGIPTCPNCGEKVRLGDPKKDKLPSDDRWAVCEKCQKGWVIRPDGKLDTNVVARVVPQEPPSRQQKRAAKRKSAKRAKGNPDAHQEP